MKAELPFPPAALTAARALVRREPLTAEAAAALPLLPACVRRALLKKAAAMKADGLIKVMPTADDFDDAADNYRARLLDPKFRAGWSDKPDGELTALILNDLCGGGGWRGWLYEAVLKAAEPYLPIKPAPADPAALQPLERAERAAAERDERAFYRSSPDALLRGEHARDDEAAGYAELEGRLLTFRRCLREYRDCEWPAAWPSAKRYAAHALLFYERIQPRYDDLKDCQLAYVFGVSSKVASTLLKAAAARWIPYEELPADGLLEYTALFYELRLLELLKRP